MATGRTTSTARPFIDRVDAGRRLSVMLDHLRGLDLVVLGLPRGGVPVASEVAKALNAPLDVIVVRKLGLPIQQEVAMGAIGEDGFEVLDRPLIARAGISDHEVRVVERRERELLEARLRRFRRGRAPIDLNGRTAVVVDDGLATGATARVACSVARHRGASDVVLAVPVGPAGAAHLVPEADEVICLRTPEPFAAVGYHYLDFQPTSDAEVVAILDEAAHQAPSDGDTAAADEVAMDVTIPAGEVSLQGHFRLPPKSRGIVIFAHGSGSSRMSPRNRYVAEVLDSAGIGTLLLDLLTPEEEKSRENIFDVRLLARRLAAAVRWVHAQPQAGDLGIGLFGASTGAAAALLTAADPAMDIRAVVSRGGRPDLAGPSLGLVTAPTLLVVGGADPVTLRLNATARRRLGGTCQLQVVPGATHLFEEPGTLSTAAELAASWFGEHLAAPNAGKERSAS